jgi:hypothetical protein
MSAPVKYSASTASLQDIVQGDNLPHQVDHPVNAGRLHRVMVQSHDLRSNLVDAVLGLGEGRE